MKVFLTRFRGLQFAFARGWYELPSHVELPEIRRLLDLLANTVVGIDNVVECTWEDLEEGPCISESAIVFVRIPPVVDQEAKAAVLARQSESLGLFQSEEPGHWPEVAWDELEVKSKLAAWLRWSIRQPNHPLAHFDVAAMPIDLLAEATSEPIELLELAEGTMAYAAQQIHERRRLDWLQCARWSMSRRLAHRLSGAARDLRAAIHQRISESPDGTLRPLLHPREIAELARLGLAHLTEGTALLSPIARLAGEQHVIEILDIEGALDVPTVPAAAPARRRATSPAEAVLAFDPLIEILPDDPWFVDLRPVVPEVQEFAERFDQQLERRDRPVQLVVWHRPGSGAGTMIRKLLRDLATAGIVTIDVRTPAAGFGFVDVLMAMLLAILENCDRNPNLELPGSTLAQLREWIAEISLSGDLRDYVLLGAGVNERVRLPSLLVLLRRLIDLAGTDSPERERIRLALDARVEEMLGYLARIIDDLHSHLAARGQVVCLHVESTEHIDLKTFDEIFSSHAKDLARLNSRLVLGFTSDADLAVSSSLSEVFTMLTFATIPEQFAGGVIEAVLQKRAELTNIFEDAAAAVEAIASYCGGRLDHALEFAATVCSLTRQSRITRMDIEAARKILLDQLKRTFEQYVATQRTNEAMPLLSQISWHMQQMGQFRERREFLDHEVEWPAPQRIIWLRLTADAAIGLGDLANAEDRARRSVDLAVQLYETREHVEVARSRTILANVLLRQGKYQEAEDAYRESAETLEKAHGTRERAEVAAALYGRANVLVRQGKLEEAEVTFRDSIGVQVKVHGTRSSADVAASLHGLANVLFQRGKYQEAEAISRESIEVGVGVFGTREHAEVATLLGGLANVLFGRGKYEEAERYYRESAAIQQRTYGARAHAEMAVSLHGLANVLERQGRYEEAESIYRESIEVQVEAYGTREHASVAASLHGLANALFSLGKYEAAEASYRESIDIQTKTFGTREHVQITMSLHGLANVLELQGKYVEAERAYRENLKAQIKAYGTREHAMVAASIQGLAKVLGNQGKYEEAERFVRESIEIQVKLYGTQDHVAIATSLHGLANVWLLQGKYEEAGQAYRESIMIQERVYGTREHVEVTGSVHGLANVLERQGKHEEAEMLYRESLEIQVKAFGTRDHVAVAASLHSLASVLSVQGKQEDAWRAYSESIEIQEKVYGTREHATVAASLHGLANVLLAQGKREEAEKTWLSVLEILERVYGTRRAPAMVVTCATLARFLLAQNRFKEALQWSSEAWSVSIIENLRLEIVQVGPIHIGCLAANQQLEAIPKVLPLLLQALHQFPETHPVRVDAETSLQQMFGLEN